MMKNKLFIFFAFTFCFAAANLFAQASNAMKPSVVTGEVSAVSASRIDLVTKDGPLAIVLSDKTEYKRVAADNPSLKSATAAAFGDVAVGDKLLVTGIFGTDKTKLPARSVYLMSKADITARNAKETEMWKTRGITGKVISVDPQANHIVVEMRSLAGNTNITVTPKSGAELMRYAPNSIRYDEAKKSTIGEIAAGDMLRALGDRSADGTSFTAEKVVTGAFKTVGGTVKSVDTAKNEVVITDLQSKKDMTIALSGTSLLKRFPPEMAARMAMFQGGGGVRPGGQPGAPGAPAGGGGAGAPGRGGPGGMRGGAGIDDMLDRFPTITIADLKVGDMIAVSSTKDADPTRITAIKLLAGIEPFVRAAQASGQTRGAGRSGQGDFNIPGLEGFGTP
jgi:ribosomal protein L24